MNKSVCVSLAFSLLASAGVFGQVGAGRDGTGESSSFALNVHPTALVPILASSDIFTTGGGASLTADFSLSGMNFRPFVGVKSEYLVSPFKADDSLSLVSMEARAGGDWYLSSRFKLRVSAGGGYYYGFINSDRTGAGNPSFSAGSGLSFLASSLLDLSVFADYREFGGLSRAVAVGAGGTFHLSGRPARLARIQANTPDIATMLAGARADVDGKGVDLVRMELDDIFPVFKNYYDDKPVGRVLIKNVESKPVEDVKITFFLKQYMDSPKDCPAPTRLAGNASVSVDLRALLTAAVLDVTEATKAAAEVGIEYSLDGQRYRSVRTGTVRLLDRNAMRWDDDRKAAAFVTAKDPRILSFAKSVAGIARSQGAVSMDGNLLAGMAIFKALDVYGISYVVDPQTPFATLSQEKGAVDFLQFPRQTLEYRAGDCDDLSILYAALLESIGIETAFVTVPGHIYLGFALETPPLALAKTMSSIGDLIMRNGKAWVPVEVTERNGGFLAAWRLGAKQWKDAESAGNAGFQPIRESWNEYEPVGLPGTPADIVLPDNKTVRTAFEREAERYATRELSPLVAKHESELALAGESPQIRNKLGIVYARYGKWNKAEGEFQAALQKEEFVPALVNLGNLYFIRKDFEAALSWYERAISRGGPTAKVYIQATSCCYHLGAHPQSHRNW